MKRSFIILSLMILAVTVQGQGVAPSVNSNFDLIDINPVVTLRIPLKVDANLLDKLTFPGEHPAFVQIGQTALNSSPMRLLMYMQRRHRQF